MSPSRDLTPQLETAPTLAAASLNLPGEARFAQISRDAPSFGGLFFEGDTLVALVTDR